MNHAITHPLFYWISVRALYRFRSAAAPDLARSLSTRRSRWMANGPSDWF